MSLEIQTLQLKKAAHYFRAINHKLRQRILTLLHKNGRMDVSSIYAKLKLEQSVTSLHLAILRKANLVSTERDGKRIFYSVNYQKLNQLHKLAAKLIEEN